MSERDKLSSLSPAALREVRIAMGRATSKFTAGGGRNKQLKPVTLRRADYERQKGES